MPPSTLARAASHTPSAPTPQALFVYAIDATLPPPFLDAARAAVAAALVAKASSHPAHEAAVLFYGADGEVEEEGGVCAEGRVGPGW